MGGDVRRNDSTKGAASAPETEPPQAAMTPMRALLDETADEDRPPGRIDPRNLVIGALLLVTMVSVAVAVVSLLASDPPAVTGTLESPPASPSTGSPTASPGEDVAGSSRLLNDFDLLPTDSEVEGWSLSDGARLLVAPLPTAVDRSARLEGTGRASACRDLGLPFSTFEVVFMLDAVPAGGTTLLRLETDRGSGRRVSLSDGRASVAVIGEAVELEARTWYRWVVRNVGEDVLTSLRSADGSSLAEAVAPGGRPGAHATEFCMTTLASSRLYLNQLNVETP